MIILIPVLFLLLLPGAVIGYIKVGRAIKYHEKMIKVSQFCIMLVMGINNERALEMMVDRQVEIETALVVSLKASDLIYLADILAGFFSPPPQVASS